MSRSLDVDSFHLRVLAYEPWETQEVIGDIKLQITTNLATAHAKIISKGFAEFDQKH